ncbi:MAG: FKBP-type peptidyl-prolyl cis-trans isomerase [Dehalococcoidia bacterium]
MKNYYRILEVEPDADEETIEKAYQKLARRYNPQSNPSKEAAARLTKINEAYGVLGQARSRREYDAARDRMSGGAGSNAADDEGWSSGRRLLIVIGGVVAIGAIAGGIIAAVVLMDDDGGDESVAAAPTATIQPGTTPGATQEGPPAVSVTPTVTSTGLQIFEVQAGTGEEVEEGSTVTVHYTLWLADGTKASSSLDLGQPFTQALAGLIPGWQEGMLGMQVGGKRRLIVPPELGYGEEGQPPDIPGNATLIFDIELLGL